MTLNEEQQLKAMQNLLHLFYDEEPLIIKHKKAMDVCFEIIGLNKTDESIPLKNQDSFTLLGVWVNLGHVESWPILDTESKIEITNNPTDEKTLVIKKQDLGNWEWCVQPNEKCLRDSKWGSLI